MVHQKEVCDLSLSVWCPAVSYAHGSTEALIILWHQPDRAQAPGLMKEGCNFMQYS